MKILNRIFLLLFIVFIINIPQVNAEDLSTCWIEESDCPAGPIDGLPFVPAVKDKNYHNKTAKQNCKYNDGGVNWINVNYRCYENAASAQAAYDKFKPYEVVGDCEKDRSSEAGRCVSMIVKDRYTAIIQVHAYEKGDFSTNIEQNAHNDKLGAKRMKVAKTALLNFNPKGRTGSENKKTKAEASEKVVKGRAYALDILGLDQPIPYAKIELELGGETYLSYTDGDGSYSFTVQTDDTKGKITLTLAGYDHDLNIFEVVDESENAEAVKIWRNIEIDENTDFVIDIMLEKQYKTSGNRAHLRALVDNYYQLAQAIDFARFVIAADVSKLRGENILPISLYAYSRGADSKKSTFYDNEHGTISLSTKDSNYNTPDSPLSVFHEFGHHIMFTQYTPVIWDNELDRGTSFNHGGLINDTTADTVGEGAATFLALLMAQEYGYVYPHVYKPSPVAFGRNWEVNYKVWDSEGLIPREEFAFVSLLNDLVDKHRDTGDDIYMDFSELWKIMKDSKNQTVKDYYDALIKVEDQAKIDALFIAHGFFWDKQEGDKKFNDKATYTSDTGETCKVKNLEPALDINNDGSIDILTEPWMDYSNWNQYPCVPTFDEGDVVGYTGSYQTTERKTFVNLPNRFMEVNNGAYNLEFNFPKNPEYDFVVSYEVTNNKLPVVFPPARYEAVATINDDLILTSDEYFQAIKDTHGQNIFRSEKKSRRVPIAVWLFVSVGIIIAIIIKRKKK